MSRTKTVLLNMVLLIVFHLIFILLDNYPVRLIGLYSFYFNAAEMIFDTVIFILYCLFLIAFASKGRTVFEWQKNGEKRLMLVIMQVIALLVIQVVAEAISMNIWFYGIGYGYIEETAIYLISWFFVFLTLKQKSKKSFGRGKTVFIICFLVLALIVIAADLFLINVYNSLPEFPEMSDDFGLGTALMYLQYQSELQPVFDILDCIETAAQFVLNMACGLGVILYFTFGKDKEAPKETV